MQPVSFEASLSVLLLGKLHLASQAEHHFSKHESRFESPFHHVQIIVYRPERTYDNIKLQLLPL